MVIHWDGYTSGYQGKRIDNTSTRDEPYEFVLGGGSTIAAFDEAVSRMRPGAIVRVEVPGEVPSLSYPIDRKQRFTDEALDKDGRTFRYRLGPQPVELGGQRALDFVLDNRTLQDFNRRAVAPPSRLSFLSFCSTGRCSSTSACSPCGARSEQLSRTAHAACSQAHAMPSCHLCCHAACFLCCHAV